MKKLLSMIPAMMLVAAISTPGLAAECSAKISADLRKMEKKKTVTRYTWKLDVSSSDKCARVHVDLITTERAPGEDSTKRSTITIVKVREGSTSRGVFHEIPVQSELVDWEFKLSRCEACEP